MVSCWWVLVRRGQRRGYTSYVWNIVITNLTKEKRKGGKKKPLGVVAQKTLSITPNPSQGSLISI
jgi:hypothetical protein